jgi:hypothetical protein
VRDSRRIAQRVSICNRTYAGQPPRQPAVLLSRFGNMAPNLGYNPAAVTARSNAMNHTGFHAAIGTTLIGGRVVSFRCTGPAITSLEVSSAREASPHPPGARLWPRVLRRALQPYCRPYYRPGCRAAGCSLPYYAPYPACAPYRFYYASVVVPRPW